MSSPSRSVRLARTASPSPGRASPIVTPGKKIKAMLSAFDDSDSDEPSRDISANKPSNDASKTHPGDEDASASESEEEDIVKPRGRMAARMQMQGQQARNGCNDGETETAFERVSRMMREEREKEKEVQQQKSGQDASGKSFEEDEDEDLPTAGRRRRPNHAERSPSRERSFSPLFMSSPTATRQNEADSDDAHNEADSDDAHNEEDSDAHPSVRPKSNDRFLALVAQKRKEREEKERAEAEKKANRAKQMEQFSSEVHSGEDSGDDAGSGRKFTQQSRPARKASKKALEEMHRETQRMSRNMQLTHQMQTKKKITKESLFAKFNFMQPGPNARAESSSVTAESQPSSDIEQNKRGGTPMTSPLLEPEKETSVEKQPLAQTKAAGDGEANPAEDIPEDLPSLDQLLSQPQEQPEVTVGRAEIQTNQQPSDPRQGQRESLTKAPVRVRLSRKSIAQHQKEDSDDDLEVITSPGRCRSIAAFENLPSRRAQEPVSMTRWKALAHLTSPTRRAATMNAAELSASLLQRAKQQAAKERKERIQELKDKGIIIETAEERAAMEDTVEDLMERARKEGEAIAKREKASKKKGEPDDEDEDDDYEVSGSEEERVDEDEDEGEGEADGEDGFIENEANEADESEGDERDEGDESEATSESEAEPAPRRKRPTRVVSDDEDDEPEPEPKTPAKQTTQIFGSAERPQFPDLPGSNGLTMSLTQAFAGTLGDTRGTQEEPTIPNSLPDPGPSNVQDSDPQVIKDSQEHQNQTTDLFAGYTQSDARVSESPAFRQFSQIPEPTQDAGFVLSPFDPSKRFMGTPTSTIETVLVGQNESQNSPQKRNRPLKRGQAPRLSVVEEDDGTSTAFDVMKKSAKPESTPFDKKKSKAKDVVEEAAEESDDEYAGLGGGSDDSEDEEDGYDQQMINDFSGEKVDEKQLAALNAYVTCLLDFVPC